MSDAKFEIKPNTGNIFKNDKKGNEKAPDYRGTVNVEGKELEIALWVKEGKKGKYFSASFKEPYKKGLPKEHRNYNTEDLPF